jgi:hypothetical protein
MKEIHGDRYSYPEQYVNNKTKINVYCPVISAKNKRVHGNFKISPNDLKRGRGCKKCFQELMSSSGVRFLQTLLDRLNYTYEIEIPFKGMEYKNPLRVDIFLCLLVKNQVVQIVLEFDGLQHHNAYDFWGGKEGLEKTQLRDFIKDLYCVNNGISLLRFSDASLPTLEELRDLIDLCKTQQVYKSYPHLQSRVRAETQLPGIHVIETSFLKQ